MNRRSISEHILKEIINELPTMIIKMLPDTPEKLLKYAQRVKEVQFAPHLNEEVKTLMKEYLLTDREYLRTFYYAMAITFYNKRPVKSPEIAIVAAQTGSGKSNLTAKILRENENYIFVDSDKYKHYRYDAQKIAKEYQVLYPFLTAPDGYDCADNIYQYAIDHQYNIIKETAPSANKGLLGVDLKDVIEKGYTVSVHILAVGELNSTLSLHERYEKQILSGLRTAKLTGLNRHDESYNSLIKNIQDLIDNSDIEQISVYKRGTKENNFEPIMLYPSNIFRSSIEAIQKARIEDNNITISEFSNRYKLLLEQMHNRTAPQEQLKQLQSVYDRYKTMEENKNE